MAVVLVMATSLSATHGVAQQPTPSAPVNPNWCSSVPASPAPPQFEHKPGQWAEVRKMCTNLPGWNKGCEYICQTAKDLWNLKKLGRLGQPSRTFGDAVPPQPAPTPPGAHD